jgi:hypothetical protein
MVGWNWIPHRVRDDKEEGQDDRGGLRDDREEVPDD